MANKIIPLNFSRPTAAPKKNSNKGVFEIKAKAKDEAEIWIYDDIGDFMNLGLGLSAKQFVEDLKGLGKLNRLTIHLNSPGGSVYDGLAIYNTLRANQARKTVLIEGMAASIASVIAMAGDEIQMAESSLMMIHQAWGVALGNAGDFEAAAEELRKMDTTIRKAYLRTEKSEDEIQALMEAETWMTSDEAVKYGFADKITEELKAAAMVFDLSKFKYRKNPAAKTTVGQDDIRQRLARQAMTCRKIHAASGGMQRGASA